jgi:uncharacterized protein (DUF433 family)
MAKTIGRFIVVDSRVCHGQPTFRGTRILVADVLDQVATGMSWEAITETWRGALNHEAIALPNPCASPGSSWSITRKNWRLPPDDHS